MNKYILVVILLTIITSCKQSVKDIESNYLKISIGKIEVSENYKWIVLLPGLGCHGCIQEGEAFMQDYVGNKNILFILTKIESLKILQKKIKIKIKDHKNIYIDRDFSFDIPTENAIYPCIVELNKGKIKSHQFQSPSNVSAFEKLRKKITIIK